MTQHLNSANQNNGNPGVRPGTGPDHPVKTGGPTDVKRRKYRTKSSGLGTMNTLNVPQTVALVNLIGSWRDIIANEKWSMAKATEEAARKLGFTVTENNVKTAGQACDPSIEWPRGNPDYEIGLKHKKVRDRVSDLEDRLQTAAERIDTTAGRLDSLLRMVDSIGCKVADVVKDQTALSELIGEQARAIDMMSVRFDGIESALARLLAKDAEEPERTLPSSELTAAVQAVNTRIGEMSDSLNGAVANIDADLKKVTTRLDQEVKERKTLGATILLIAPRLQQLERHTGLNRRLTPADHPGPSKFPPPVPPEAKDSGSPPASPTV